MRRRHFVLSSMTAFGFAAAGPLSSVVWAAASAARTPRVVVLDWGLVETLLALGIVPVGVAEIDDYNTNVVTPAMPPGVVDVGLRLSPSLELLAQLAPDLILMNSSQESQRAQLEQIAPVSAWAIYTDAGHPYRRAEEVTLELGALTGREAAAHALVQSMAAGIDADRKQLTARIEVSQRRPAYVFRFFDARHVGIYGTKSLIDDVLGRLDVDNAWRGPTDYWGIGVEPLEALGARSTANVLYFDPLPPGGARGLLDNPLWRAIPAVASARATELGSFWGFGMLPSARRFSAMVTDALSRVETQPRSVSGCASPAGAELRSSPLRAQQTVAEAS